MRQKWKDVLKVLSKISIAILQGILVLFVGLIISFIFFDMATTSPYLNKYGGLVDPSIIDKIVEDFGMDDPIFKQFGKYLHHFFYGSWGESYILLPGGEITHWMKIIVPKSIETMIIPLLIGLIGIKLGKIWVKKRDKLIGFIIQLFTIIGLAMPIFFMATIMQIEYRHDLPIIYYSDPSLLFSPRITGFPLFDSILDGNWTLAVSILKHGVLPIITLSFITTALIIKQTQTNLERNSRDTTFVSNSLTAGKLFGILFALILLIETIFNRTGFGYYFLMSIYAGETLFINGCFFMIIMLFSVTIVLANLIPVIYKFLRKKAPKKIKLIRKNIRSKIQIYREKIYNVIESFKGRDNASPHVSEPKIKIEKRVKTKSIVELKKYVITTLKNPFTLVGLVLLIFLISISAVPQLFTPYSLKEITIPYFPPGGIPFDPPSSSHPFGTTKYGYDVLARILYGIQNAFVFGIIVTLIGLVFGAAFGYLAGTSHRYVHNGIIGLMALFFIIPGLMLLMILTPLQGYTIYTDIMIIGLLLTISFAGIIANTIRRGPNSINTIKIVIKYVPLEMFFGIMLYQMLGFLGFAHITTTNLGITLSWGRATISGWEWSVFWPGMYIFIISLSLILLHEGIEAPPVQRDVLNSSTNSS